MKINKEILVNLWSDRPYPPFLMKLCIKSTVLGLKKVFPKSRINFGGNYWNNKRGNYFFQKKQFVKTVSELSKKALKSPKFIYGLFKIALQRAKDLRRFSEKYKKQNISNVSSDKLLEFFKKMCERYYHFYSYATVAPLLGYSQENIIYQKMDQIIRLKLKNNQEKISDYLIKMTSPPKMLKTHDLELLILKIAKRIKKLKIINKKQILKKFRKELLLIKNNFESLSFDFCDSIGWDLNYFVNLVLEKSKTDIDQRIREIINYNLNKKNEFKSLCKNLDLSTEERKPFEIIRNLGYSKWTREYEFQEALYNLKFVIDELGRRCNFSTIESKYLFPEEFKLALINPKKYKLVIKKRLKNLLILLSPSTELVIDGERARRRYKLLKFEESLELSQIKEIKGMTAYGGKVRGCVKIINHKNDLRKMKAGDILVSVATDPNLSSAMKKSSAIVTDEGGITSHAAIVARELKIPCIVGTKMATKILKDGDLVEIDATKGIIKIIQ